jgi:hypothetical protein
MDELGALMKKVGKYYERENPSELPVIAGLIVAWRFVGGKQVIFKFKRSHLGFDMGPIAAFNRGDSEPAIYIDEPITRTLPKKEYWKLKEKRKNIILAESEIHLLIPLSTAGAMRRRDEKDTVIILQTGFHGFTGRNRPGEE